MITIGPFVSRIQAHLRTTTIHTCIHILSTPYLSVGRGVLLCLKDAIAAHVHGTWEGGLEQLGAPCLRLRLTARGHAGGNLRGKEGKREGVRGGERGGDGHMRVGLSCSTANDQTKKTKITRD